MKFHACYDMQRNRWFVMVADEAPIMSTESYMTRALAETVVELLNTDKTAFQSAMNHMCDKMMLAS
jgi:hypothetical protein